MFKFLAKKLMERQLKGLPEDQRELILAMVEKNPGFFKKIAEEIKEKTKTGKSEQQASLEVMMAHRQEMQQIALEIQKAKLGK
jgi:hypothetical protein